MLTHGSFARQSWDWRPWQPRRAARGAGGQARGAKNLFGLNYSFKDMTGKDASMLKKSGATTVRWIMFWPRIEPTSGHFDWSVPDKLVGDLAAKGIRVLPIMWGSPRWVARRPRSPRRSRRRHGMRGRAS